MKNLKTAKANLARSKKADEYAKEIFDKIRDATSDGEDFLKKKGSLSYAKIERYLNGNKIPTRRGGKWSRKTVQRLIDRIKKKE